MTFAFTSVRARLTAAFGGLALGVALVSGLALHDLDGANDRFTDFVSGIHARLLLAGDIHAAVGQRAIAARNLVLLTDPKELEAEKAAVARAHAEVEEKLAQLQKAAEGPDVSPKARELIEAIGRVEHQYGPVALEIVKQATSGQHEAAIEAMNTKCRPLLAALEKASDEYSDYTQSHSQELVAHAEADFYAQRRLLLAICAAAFIGAMLAGALITRSITRALGAEPADLSEAARRVAEGELSPIPGASNAAPRSVLASLGHMQGNLSTIVTQVRQASDSIATGAAQIAGGNADLSQRTEEQASALQQTAATMEELGSTVRNNAENARQADQLAQGASHVASRGGDVVAKVVDTMKGINGSSKRIADIIGVIDGIAFQTNILALNAAVEAARAGEQGRGFAVVAGEVRTLAQRSASAAREIKVLIDDSVQQVEQGTTLVAEAGQTMAEIVGSIQRVSDVVSEISSANAEQSTGVGQVGLAVSQMDQVTQQNAALVEESAAAAESLRIQADGLVQAVAVFKLHAEQARPAAPAAKPAAPRAAAGKALPVSRPAPRASALPKPAAPAVAAVGAGADDWADF